MLPSTRRYFPPGNDSITPVLARARVSGRPNLTYRCRQLMVICALLAFGSGMALAQNNEETLATLKTRTSSFFRNLKDGIELERAFDELLVKGPLAPNGADGTTRSKVKKLIDRIHALQVSYGALLEAEEVESKMIGRDLVLQKYLFKTERLPVIWYFTYYRPPVGGSEDNDWFVISVRFDMRYESLAD